MSNISLYSSWFYLRINLRISEFYRDESEVWLYMINCEGRNWILFLSLTWKLPKKLWTNEALLVKEKNIIFLSLILNLYFQIASIYKARMSSKCIYYQFHLRKENNYLGKTMKYLKLRMRVIWIEKSQGLNSCLKNYSRL